MATLNYSPKEHLRVVHTAVIIRVESINQKLGVTVAEFARLFDLWGLTNGKIWVLAERAYPKNELKRVIREILKPLDLIEGEDWVPANALGACDHRYEYQCLYQKLPDLEGLTWLDSIFLEDGNWIWYKHQHY